MHLGILKGDEIQALNTRFSEIFRKFKLELRAKRISATTIAKHLIQLEPELKIEQLREVKITLSHGMPTDRLFSQLGPFFTFTNYNLLELLIKEYGSTQLWLDMVTYVRNMEEFMSNTKVHEVMHYWPEGKVCYAGFSQLWIKLTPSNASTYTLKELHELQTKLCTEIKLSKTFINLGWLEPSSSIDAVWLVPTEVTCELKNAITNVDNNLHKESIQLILLKKELLYLHVSSKGNSIQLQIFTG